MKSIKSPTKIPGLTLWLDASDISTVNNGDITNNGIVKSFRDKVNNVDLKNILTGPIYSYGLINNKNIISFQPVYNPDISSEAATRALGATNLSILNSATTSIFCVYQPTGIFFTDPGGNQKYIFNVIDNNIMNMASPVGIPNKSIFTAEDSLGTASQRQNPSGRYVEADTTSFNSTSGYQQAFTYHEHIPSRNSWTQSQSSLNKLSMTIARSQERLKKISFIFRDNEYIDDFVLGGYAGGVPSSVGPLPRNIRLTGSASQVSTPQHICLGAYVPKRHNHRATVYPFVGYFCELLYFDRYLTDGETNTVKQYLKKKWGV